MEKGITNRKKRFIKHILNGTDYFFIGIKCFLFCYIFWLSYLNESPFVGKIYSHYAPPLLGYFILNVLRLIKRKLWFPIFIEIALNIFCIFWEGNIHFIYLGMSMTSFIVIWHENKLKA